MRTIQVQITGTDGESHGHGGWEMDPEDFEVSERQYQRIAEAFSRGETDLESMKVYGLGRRCKEIISEYRGYARDRGACMADVDVNINVVSLEDDDED
ncbi:MAG: hypothetical protein MJZ16_14545 [Bacteroidales bacterium]|nr:hypothetical protein [Bacteroidales bacterium]